jgi:hypothetical protein
MTMNTSVFQVERVLNGSLRRLLASRSYGASSYGCDDSDDAVASEQQLSLLQSIATENIHQIIGGSSES